ncbi:MAG: hypothetical protein GTO41_23930 [Burkholderiales bacterium]|nr:hypothetical protein [Burkholderiales bacterium]
MFYGLVSSLAERARAPEAQLPFVQARENFYSAARNGLAAPITWLSGGQRSVRDLLLDRLLPRARRALERGRLNSATIDRYLGVIEQRVRTGKTGAAWQRAYVAKHGKDMPSLVSAYCANLRSGAPVHEWEV